MSSRTPHRRKAQSLTLCGVSESLCRATNGIAGAFADAGNGVADCVCRAAYGLADGIGEAACCFAETAEGAYDVVRGVFTDGKEDGEARRTTGALVIGHVVDLGFGNLVGFVKRGWCALVSR